MRPARALGRGRSPGALFHWAALAVAVGSVLAMLLVWTERVPQANAHWVALLLPIHALWAWIAWRGKPSRD